MSLYLTIINLQVNVPSIKKIVQHNITMDLILLNKQGNIMSMVEQLDRKISIILIISKLKLQTNIKATSIKLKEAILKPINTTIHPISIICQSRKQQMYQYKENKAIYHIYLMLGHQNRE